MGSQSGNNHTDPTVNSSRVTLVWHWPTWLNRLLGDFETLSNGKQSRSLQVPEFMKYFSYLSIC